MDDNCIPNLIVGFRKNEQEIGILDIRALQEAADFLTERLNRNFKAEVFYAPHNVSYSEIQLAENGFLTEEIYQHACEALEKEDIFSQDVREEIDAAIINHGRTVISECYK